jgi:hypothetical protein
MQTIEWHSVDGKLLGKIEVPTGVIITVEGALSATKFDTAKLEEPPEPVSTHAANMKKRTNAEKRRARKARKIAAIVKKHSDSDKKWKKERIAHEANTWHDWKGEKKPEIALHDFLVINPDVRRKILSYVVVTFKNGKYDEREAIEKAYRNRQKVFDKIKYSFKTKNKVDLKKPEFKYDGPHPISLMLTHVRSLMFVNKALFAIGKNFIENLQIHQFIPKNWIMPSSNKTVEQCLAKGYGMAEKNTKAMTYFLKTEQIIRIVRRKEAKNERRHKKRVETITTAMNLTKDRVFDQITSNVGFEMAQYARKWQTKAGSNNRDYDDEDDFGFGRRRNNRPERGKDRRGNNGNPRQNHRMIIASMPINLEVHKGWSVKDVLFYKKPTKKRSRQPWDMSTSSGWGKSNIQSFMHQMRDWVAERYKIKRECFYIYYVIEHSKDGDLVKFEINI